MEEVCKQKNRTGGEELLEQFCRCLQGRRRAGPPFQNTDISRSGISPAWRIVWASEREHNPGMYPFQRWETQDSN